MEPVEQLSYLADREPAPGRLALVQRFVNTVDFEHRREMLSSPARLRDVLTQLGFLDRSAVVDAGDLAHALEVREALRSLALANNGADVDHDALSVLERAVARGGGLVVRFGERGSPALEPRAAGVDAVLADLVGIVYTATADGTWRRLKACRRDVCRWLFYDRSHNRSARWCQMAVCGNRTKTRAYRSRRVG